MDREGSSLVLTGAIGAMVIGVFQVASPGIANVRVSQAHDPDLASAEKSAAWLSAILVGSVAVIAREPLVFIVGSGTIVALSWWHRHANSVDPKLAAQQRRMLPVDSVPTPGSSDLEHAGDSDSANASMESSMYEGAF